MQDTLGTYSDPEWMWAMLEHVENDPWLRSLYDMPDGGGLPVIAMIIEEYATTNKMPLMEVYDKLEDAARNIVKDMGDVIDRVN